MFVHGAWSAGWRSYLYNVALIRRDFYYVPYGSTLLAGLAGWLSTAPAWLPLVFLLPAGLRMVRRNQFFAAFWLISSLVGMSLSGCWYWHYWIQLMPPLSIAASAGIPALLPRRRALAVTTVTLILAMPLLSIGRIVSQSPQAGSDALYHRLGYRIAQDVSAYIRDHTQDNEAIYVAFSEADIYYLSRRRAAVPYLFYAYVVALPGAYEEIVDTVARRVPTYVLALSQPITSIDPDGRFWQTLEANYRPEKTFETAVLYRRRPN
jgi:hypothetical protein